MSFIRSKQIKNKSYAYLIENYWDKGLQESRQKKQKYLGRIIKVTPSESKENKEFIDMQVPVQEIYKMLLHQEFLKLNFKQINTDEYEDETSYINLKDLTIRDKAKKAICLEINESFLCDHTLMQLMKYTTLKNLKESRNLAQVMVAAGLKPQKEVFVALVKKLLNEKKKA